MKTMKTTSVNATSTGAFCDKNDAGGTKTKGPGNANHESAKRHAEKTNHSARPDAAGATKSKIRAALDTLHSEIYSLDSERDLTAAMDDIHEALSKLQESAEFKVQSKKHSELPDARSPKSQAASPAALPDNATTYLQTWLEEQQIMFQNFAELVPQLETTELSSADRMRLNGSGVRRYGFIEKTADVAGDFPQFWPAIVDDTGKLKEMVGEIEVLRNLFVWFRYLARVVQDLLLLSGDEAFRLSGSYYTAARDGARRKNPEAQQVYDMLRLFWKRPRRTSEEPTEQELMRDARAFRHGKADGAMAIANESPHVTRGRRQVVDDVSSAKRRV